MEHFYQNMLTYIRLHPLYLKTILLINKVFPLIITMIYPMILIYLYLTSSNLLIPTLIKPLIAFISVTIFRKIINRPRPYETMNINPLVMHKQGQSFPSRHALSAMIIALVCINIHPLLGLFMTILAISICLSRILTGTHYISDVLTSIIIAIIIYII